MLGILALVHGTSSLEVRGLRTGDIDHDARAVRLGKRPHPVPLDPASWDVLQRCPAHRDAKATENPHVMVTRGTRARTCAASAAYVSHLLDQCGVPPRMLRSTRLLGLLNTMDPKLVAAVFGKDAESVMIYLADHVDPGRLPDQPATRPQEKS